MEEHVVAYRGICLSEAMEVVGKQRYAGAEERKFSNEIEIKAVFGPGVYLVSDYTVAAEYAYCHAEANMDKGSVIRQTVHFQNPMRLDRCFGEKELRSLALAWKYPNGTIDKEIFEQRKRELSRWAGNIIRDYLLALGYDGVVYHITDELTYYISYNPGDQISQVQFDFVYDIEDLQSYTFSDLRERYRMNGKHTAI